MALCLQLCLERHVLAGVKLDLKTDFFKRGVIGFDILISRYVSGYYRIKGPSSHMGENTRAREKLMVPSRLLFFKITDQIPSKTLGQKTSSHERSVAHSAWSHQELQMAGKETSLQRTLHKFYSHFQCPQRGQFIRNIKKLHCPLFM